MKRFLLVVLAAITLTGSVVAPAAPTTQERALNAVVDLVMSGDEGSWGCSGFVFTPGRVMTNAHCTDGALTYTVTFHDGTVAKGKFVGQSITDDIGVIAVKTHVYPISIGTAQSLAPFTKVYAVGHPVGYQWTITEGVVSRIHPPRNLYGDDFATTAPTIQHSAGTAGGSSGGPILNEEGEVVGVVTGGNRFLQFVGWAVVIDHALEVVGSFE